MAIFDRLSDVFVEHAPEDALDLLPGLYSTTDNGRGVLIPAWPFVVGRAEGWERLADAFLRLNEPALASLGITPQLEPGKDGLGLRLVPAGRAGAVPLRSGQTGQVRGGFVVVPRFGWAGIGQVLSETGWHASPEFLPLPMVPGSGREVPPWVLAGPVLARLRQLLRSFRRGYLEAEAVLAHPRGRILWSIRLEGRRWTAAEAEARWPLTPEKLELIDGKIYWSDEDRENMLAILLENVGAARAVRLGDPDVWRAAIGALNT